MVLKCSVVCLFKIMYPIHCTLVVFLSLFRHVEVGDEVFVVDEDTLEAAQIQVAFHYDVTEANLYITLEKLRNIKALLPEQGANL